ncbi:MAG: polysaccharide biosynthesis C-terminal domain-containing protein, partial [Clostridia bacterium]|nr:polysaccharide biosynthesis C-terminal domain-containing protein [Clostridia bacterium]
MFGKKKEAVSRIFIFEEMTPVKAVLTLAIPTIINQLVNVIYNLADTFYVGRLNNPAMVAAISLAAPVMIMLTGMANLFVVGGCALIAKALGAKDIDKARQLATLCPLMAFCVACVISFFSLTFIDNLAYYAGALETNFVYTRDYLFWVFGMNAIPSMVGVTLGAGLRGRGYSKFEMVGITSGNILNIILDPIFIYYFGWGIAGAAWATILSSLISCIVMGYWIWIKKDTYIDAINSRVDAVDSWFA